MSRTPARNPALLLVVASLLAATVATAASRRNLNYALPEDRIEAFTLSVTQVVETSLVTLPPEADAYDTDDLMQRLSRAETTASGRLERVVARAFRDGSLGLVTRVESLAGTTDRGEGPRPLEINALQGKSVSLRVLKSGQVVDSFGWTHLSGAGGGGDLVTEALLQSVLRLPNTVPSKRPVMATWDLRIPVDPFLEREQAWVLTWTEVEPPADCRRCTALAYTGTLTERSRDTHPARPMSLDGEGTVEGTVVLGKPARRLLQHDWSMTWTRTTRSHRADASLRGEILQSVELTGSIRAEAP